MCLVDRRSHDLANCGLQVAQLLHDELERPTVMLHHLDDELPAPLQLVGSELERRSFQFHGLEGELGVL